MEERERGRGGLPISSLVIICTEKTSRRILCCSVRNIPNVPLSSFTRYKLHAKYSNFKARFIYGGFNKTRKERKANTLRSVSFLWPMFSVVSLIILPDRLSLRLDMEYSPLSSEIQSLPHLLSHVEA